MQAQEMCQVMTSNALALLTMQCPMIDMEKNIHRLIQTHLSEFKDVTVKNFDNEHIKNMMRAVAHMILEETK